MVGEFHTAMGLPIEGDPEMPDKDRVRLRMSLLLEEVAEVMDSFQGEQGNRHSRTIEKLTLSVERSQYWSNLIENSDVYNADLQHIAKELADLVYVTYGMAHELGVDLDAVLEEVHSSNMSKLDEDGKPMYNEQGKVMKGPNFRPADLSMIVPQVFEEIEGGEEV